MTEDAPTTKQKKTLIAKLLRPIIVIPLLLLILILTSPFLVRAWYLRGVPDVEEPFDTKEFASFKVADEDNAYTGYAEALSLFEDPTRHWDFSGKSDRVLQAGWQAADDDIRQFLKDNERALLVWKEATQKDEAQYLPADEYEWDGIIPIAGAARSFVRGALLIAERSMAEGQPEDAWEWYRAAIRCSRHIGKNGGLVERLVGAGCFEMTARQLEIWLADPAVSKDLILQSMQQLQQDWQLTEDNATIIKVEYVVSRNLFEKIEKGESHVLESEAWSNGLNSVDESETPNIYYYFKGEPELNKRLVKIFIRNQMKYYSLPPWQRPEQLGDCTLFKDQDGLVPGDPSFTIDEFDRAYKRSLGMGPGFFQAMINFEADELRYRTLLAVFAGQAFHRDHGRFPETLGELVPEYLESIPIDTYDVKPLKYRFDPAGPVVYSVFENRIDDGGVEWSAETKPEDEYRPEDIGSQMRLYEPRPLVAPRPPRG